MTRINSSLSVGATRRWTGNVRIRRKEPLSIRGIRRADETLIVDGASSEKIGRLIVRDIESLIRGWSSTVVLFFDLRKIAVSSSIRRRSVGLDSTRLHDEHTRVLVLYIRKGHSEGMRKLLVPH